MFILLTYALKNLKHCKTKLTEKLIPNVADILFFTCKNKTKTKK